MVYSVESGETVYEQAGCIGTRLYEAAGNEYVQLAMEPECGIPEHALPIAVSFCVLQGEGLVLVDGNETIVKAGEMVECPPDVSRGWKNAGAGILKILVIKRT